MLGRAAGGVTAHLVKDVDSGSLSGAPPKVLDDPTASVAELHEITPRLAAVELARGLALEISKRQRTSVQSSDQIPTRQSSARVPSQDAIALLCEAELRASSNDALRGRGTDFHDTSIQVHATPLHRKRPNGWRVSGSRRAEGDERVRCTRMLGSAVTQAKRA